MRVTLWGVRGSLPSPLTSLEYQEKLRNILLAADGVDLSDDEKIEAFIDQLPEADRGVVGGNTTCIEVSDDETLLVFDAGSGLRRLGLKLMALPDSPFARGEGVAHLFFSHHHHDHTGGFPFFTPAYIPGNVVHFYGVHDRLEDRMVGLQVHEYFPVPFHVMASKKIFHQLRCDVPYQIDAFTVTPIRMQHPGDSYGFRVEWKDKVFVFAADSEYKNPSAEQINYYVEAFRNADVLYFDAQYTLLESFIKEDWGHSSALIGVDFAAQADVKCLVLGHHDPSHTDGEVADIVVRARRYCEELYPDSDLEIRVGREDDTFDLSQ